MLMGVSYSLLLLFLLVGLNYVDLSVIKEMKEDYAGALAACE